jgi:hypothetical protein
MMTGFRKVPSRRRVATRGTAQIRPGVQHILAAMTGAPAVTDLVGQLSTRSEDFRTRWAARHVRFHRTGFKQLHHPVVGDLGLNFEAFELSADLGLTMIAYTPCPAPRPRTPKIVGGRMYVRSMDERGTQALADTPPGPTLSVLLEEFDPAHLSVEEAIPVLRAWSRQRAHDHARLAATLVRVAALSRDSSGGLGIGRVVRSPPP